MASNGHNIALWLFVSFFIFRYLRTVVSIYTFVDYKPKPLAEKPKYRAESTTVIIPTTFKTPGELVKCLRGIASGKPARIIVVTCHEKVEAVQKCCCLNSFEVKVLGVDRLHKRIQIIRGLEEVTTDITVFADDDVQWPAQYLDYLLAIFEDPNVGAGGTRQRTLRTREPINCWNFLGIGYLERRVWNNITTNAIDGSLSTLSGRTAAYRTNILKNDEFRQFFLEDSWSGQKLNSDDDKCLTRWVYARGWDISLQSDSRAIIETTLETSPKYIHQCMRWARSHWRGNFTVMQTERYWCSRKFLWGLYVIYIGQFQTPALIMDTLSVVLLMRATERSPDYQKVMLLLLGMWILFTKVVKMIPHFVRHPEDLKFLPVSVIFSYLHGFINVYALFTLHHTGWGSQDLNKLQYSGARGNGR